jgi:phage-related baseplate assembly protein
MALSDTPPILVNTDANTIINELVADYEGRTGKMLQPGQVERLLINSFAYRESLIRSKINGTAAQMLVKFATYPLLDYLGELVGCIRLVATPATVTINFVLVTGHSDGIIPAGTQINTPDGLITFATTEDVAVLTADTDVNIVCTATQTGKTGNGYIIGSITTVITPVSIVDTVANVDVSAGGADDESDDNYRERIILAPDAFSTAGSEEAYKYHARTANQTIIDVSVTNPIPGTVNLCPMVEGGIVTPGSILTDVYDACNAKNVRPLTDTVVVLAPTKVDYAVEVDIVIFDDADAATVTQLANDALTTWTGDKGKKLGRDILVNAVRAKGWVTGTYSLTVVSPTADIIIGDESFANCTGVTVNITGTTHG